MRGSSFLALVLTAASCDDGRNFRDPNCADLEEGQIPSASWGTVTQVGLFDARGEPWCGTARIFVRQFRGEFTELARDPFFAAREGPNGGLAIFPATCNLYDHNLPLAEEPPPHGEAWRACSSTALQYRVEVPGCAPIESVWTWDDNYYPGIIGKSFEIPVRLTCVTSDIDASIVYPDVQRAFPPERPPYDVPNDVGRPSSD